VALKNSVKHRAIVIFEVILLKHTHTFARPLDNISFGWGQLAGKNPHKRGLTGAVGSYYTVTVTWCELHVYVLEQDAFAKLHGEIIDSYHFSDVFDFGVQIYEIITKLLQLYGVYTTNLFINL